MINCSLGDDGVSSYEDTCSFTCNAGYELTGSDTRTCQSNGNWSGTDDMCERGTYYYKMQLLYMHNKLPLTVRCGPSPTNPDNGRFNCSLGDDGILSYEDTCNFTCNTGYELTGSDTRTCQSDGIWSGSNGVCNRGMYLSV